MIFDKLSKRLNPEPKDSIYMQDLRSFKEYSKIRFWDGVALACYLSALIIVWLYYFTYSPQQPGSVIQVSRINNQVQAGRVIALGLPRHTETTVTNWAVKAVNTIGNFGFLDFNRDLESYRQYFTPSGFEAYKKRLEAQDLKNRLQDKKQTVTTTVIGQIKMVGGDKGFASEIDKKKYWQVVVPVNVATTSGTTKDDKKKLELVIVLENGQDGRSGFFINEIHEKRN